MKSLILAFYLASTPIHEVAKVGDELCVIDNHKLVRGEIIKLYHESTGLFTHKTVHALVTLNNKKTVRINLERDSEKFTDKKFCKEK